MTEHPPEGQKQETPKGYEIPVPKKADVLRDLEKLAPKPKKSQGADSSR